MAFKIYEDRPGMIGMVGTVLGNRKINIAGLQVGRRVIEGEAGMGLNLDSSLSQEIISELRSQSGIKQALFIEL